MKRGRPNHNITLRSVKGGTRLELVGGRFQLGYDLEGMEQAIELAVVFVAMVPFLRLMTCRPFLRRLGTAPGPAVGGASAIVGVIGISSWAAVTDPWLLRFLAGGSVVAMSVAWWRSRP